MNATPALLFVYNADAGIFNALSDWAHKILSPATYACSLCALTYSHVGMRAAWKRFLLRLDLPAEFLHRDEFRARFGREDCLPAVFVRRAEELDILIPCAELDAARDLGELMGKLETALQSSSRVTPRA
jgi:hypothetical protein